MEYEAAARVIKEGKIAVVPTDTIYGVVGLANRPEVVEEIYALKHRSPSKPFIVLISSISQLSQFGIEMDSFVLGQLNKHWPGPVSVVLPCQNEDYQYLHRGEGSVAFRLPKHRKLIKLIEETGPLVAPSANPEGKPPANTANSARAYFGSAVEVYIDGGLIDSTPSKLIKIDHGQVAVLRQ